MEKRKFPASQREALRQGVTYYFTGKPCKHKHLSERFAKNKNCRECLRIRNRKRTEAKDYWIGYGDEAYRDQKRAYAKSYYQRHKHEHRKGVRKRRGFEKSASVATKKGITELRRIKLEAQMLSIDTGVKHEVDHIIPLIHKKICGLNVPVNVQILTKQENRAKASRLCTKTQERELMEMLKKSPSGN